MKVMNQWRTISTQPIPQARSRLLLRWSGYLFSLLGILVLSYCGYVLFEAKIFQAYQSWRFESALKNPQARASAVALPPALVLPDALETTLPPAEGKATSVPAPGGVLIGRIEISRIGFSAMVMEGIDNRTLRHAVGHIPGTALPGVPGNVAIAGHRDTFFRELRQLRKDDEITLTTLQGSYRYRVAFTLVVEPREVWVLKNTDDATLTLVTCYPFYYVGPAPQRFIVRANRIPDAPEPFLSEK